MKNSRDRTKIRLAAVLTAAVMALAVMAGLTACKTGGGTDDGRTEAGNLLLYL